MKQLFLFLFVLLSFQLMVPTAVQATDIETEDMEDIEDPFGSGSCGDGEYVDLKALYGNECKKEYKPGSVKFCKCMNRIAVDNVLLQSGKDEKPFLVLHQNRGKHIETFEDVYSKMVHESQLQATVFGISNKSPNSDHIGCTANDMQEFVDVAEKTSMETQAKALKRLQAKNQRYLDRRCQQTRSDPKEEGDCKVHRERHNLIEEKLKLNSMAPCMSRFSLIQDARSTEKLQRMFKMKGKFDAKKQLFLTQMEKIINSPNPSSEIMNSVMVLNLAQKALSPTIDILSTCNSLAKFAHDTIVEEDLAGGEVIPVQDHDGKFKRLYEVKFRKNLEACNGDVLCEQFAAVNKDMLKENFWPREISQLPESCITFNEFKLTQGMPSKELLDEFSKSGRHHDLLEAPSSSRTDLEKAQVEFLRSNPILAGIAATSKDKRKDLAEALKKFAQKHKDSDEGTKMKAYIKFMKEDVGKIVKDEKHMGNTNQFICKQLANNFAAIHLANDIPDPEDEKSSNDIADLFSEMDKCKRSDFNDSSTTDIKATLKASPLFSLGSKNPQASKEDQKNQYKDFTDKYCKGFDEFKQSCKAKGKWDEKHAEKCRIQFLAKTGFAPVSEAITEGNVITNVTSEVFETVMNYSSESHQNHAAKKWWRENVGSKMSNDVIAGRGNVNDFRMDQMANQSIYENAAPPAELYKTTELPPGGHTGVVNNNLAQLPGGSGSTGDGAAPSNIGSRLDTGDQEQPVQTNFNNLDKTSQIDNVIPNYNNLQTPQQKQQAIASAQQQLQKVREESNGTLTPDQRIAEQILKEEQVKVDQVVKIAEGKEPKVNDEAPFDNGSGAATFTGNRTLASLPDPTSVIPLANPGSNFKVNIEKKGKPTLAEQRNKTLLTNYETMDGSVVDEKILVNGTVPSLVLTDATPIKAGGEVDASELRLINGDYGADVVNLDQDDYNKLQSKQPGADETLKKMLVEKYKNSPLDEQVIQINNPKPDKYLLYRLVAKGTHFELERVVVKNTYSSFIQTLGTATGTNVERNPGGNSEKK